MSETPEFKSPVPDPNKVDRITYREVISEWRNIAFKKIDENVSLKAENEMFKVDIKKLKDLGSNFRLLVLKILFL